MGGTTARLPLAAQPALRRFEAMIPWEELDRVTIPGARSELSLHRRQAEFSIRVNGYELMNSRVHGSEESVAELVCEPLAGVPAPRVLAGGLGMGYSLAACNRCLGADAEIQVVEIVPAVVRWCEGPLGSLAGYPLRDPRVRVRQQDIRQLLASAKAAYHGIVLDVDNGPSGLTQPTNGQLYTDRGLRTLATALKPQGRLGVWSAGADPAFTRRLRAAGFHVDVHRVPARRGKRGASHTLWIASKREPS